MLCSYSVNARVCSEQLLHRRYNDVARDRTFGVDPTLRTNNIITLFDFETFTSHLWFLGPFLSFNQF